MKSMKTVEMIQAARKAGLDMKEVSARLDAAVGEPNGLHKWREWIAKQLKPEFALGH